MKTRQPIMSGARKGLTLIELIIAMTILSVGLLAIVGVSAGISRQLGESRSDNIAAIYSQSRFEKLAGTACTSLTLNSWVTSTFRNVTEKYRVTDSGNNTRMVTDSVAWTTREGTRRQAFTTLLPCRPGA